MEKIVIKDMDPDIKEFLAMPQSLIKNIKYRDLNHRQIVISNILKTDEGDVYYGYTEFSLRKGKSYYLKQSYKEGFTLDKKGKLSIWWGRDIARFRDYELMLRAFKLDWFLDVPTLFTKDYTRNPLWKLITKTLFEKVLNGTVTNPIDYCAAYLKMSRIKASPKFLYKLLIADISVHKGLIHTANSVYKNLDHYFVDRADYQSKSIEGSPNAKDSVFGKMNSVLRDIEQQAILLERKIDIRWSIKRLNKLHNDWTKEIMLAEAESIPDVKLTGLDKLKVDIPYGIELLDTQKKVFAEGSEMKHCVYTNYWHSMLSGQYAAFKVSLLGRRLTLGLRKEGKDNWKFDQLYGIRNEFPDADISNFILKNLLASGKDGKVWNNLDVSFISVNPPLKTTDNSFVENLQEVWI